MTVEHRTRWTKPLFMGLGFLWLGVAMVGLFLPLIPTTGPILLAAFFFARSSERIHDWLLSHRRFGKLIRDWQEYRGMPVRAKVWAVILIAATFAFSIFYAVEGLGLKIGLAVFAVGLITFIVTRPTAPAS